MFPDQENEDPVPCETRSQFVLHECNEVETSVLGGGGVAYTVF